MGFLWFQTLRGSCSVVSEQVPPGVLHLLILNDDGVKARRTIVALAPPGMRLAWAPAQAPSPHSLTHAHTECTEYFLCCWAKPRELRIHLRGHLVPSSPLSFLPSSSLSVSPSPLPSCLSFSCPCLSPLFSSSLLHPVSLRDPGGLAPTPSTSSAKANRDQYQWVSRMWFPWQQCISCLCGSQPWPGCRGDSPH